MKPTKAETTQPIRFLALGDSYTIGEGVDTALSWPWQLTRMLRDGMIPCEDPVVIARTGWTTDELAQAIHDASLEGTYDLVSLLIGVNNQYRGRSLKEYAAEFQSLLDTAIRYAGGDPARVVVLSIPDWGVTPFAEGRNSAVIASEIDAFNDAGLSTAQLAGCRVVDVTAISRRAATDPSLLTADGLHPSGIMYTEWAEMVRKTLF